MLSIPRTISSVVSVASAIHASGLVKSSIRQVCKRRRVLRRGDDSSPRLDSMMKAVPTTEHPSVSQGMKATLPSEPRCNGTGAGDTDRR